MRGKCQHPVVFARVWTHGVWITLLGDSQDADARRCDNCHAWLPLGPARDDGEFAEAVAVEVRAAEIAALSDEIGDDPDDFMYVGEFNGWEIHRLDKVGAIDTGRAPGYLARCITTHTEQREASDE